VKKKYITIKKPAEFKEIGNKGSKFYSHSLILITRSSPQKYFLQDKKIKDRSDNIEVVENYLATNSGDQKTDNDFFKKDSQKLSGKVFEGDKKPKKAVKNEVKNNSLQAKNFNLNIFRVGYTVSKKISKSAVKRNLIKRRLRACFDNLVKNPSHDFFSPKNDYLIIAKKEILDFDFKKILQDMKYCFKNISKTKN
jgi:ribonuclease P protein component